MSNNNRTTYQPGDIVDLMFETTSNVASSIGDVISVEILDIFDNLISVVDAENIGNMYVAEYTIPIDIKSYYNINNADESMYDTSTYALKDRWNILGTLYEFEFSVLREKESPIKNNSIIEVNIDGIESTDNSSLNALLKFTTKLNPFYCTVGDVVDVFQSYLSKLDPFEISNSIIDHSLNVDLHMKPDVITYRNRYDNAVKNYVAYDVAYNFLVSGPLDVEAEAKDLEGFKVYKKYDRDIKSGIHKKIAEHTEYFQNIILAGGKDTPFISQTFIKGLYDPNRVNSNRANIDTSDSLPWANISTVNSIVTGADGRQYEIRGTRTIDYRWRVGYNK